LSLFITSGRKNKHQIQTDYKNLTKCKLKYYNILLQYYN